MPGDTPQVHKNYFKIHMNRDVIVAVKPIVTVTSSNLYNYDSQRYIKNLLHTSDN